MVSSWPSMPIDANGNLFVTAGGYGSVKAILYVRWRKNALPQ